MLHKMTSGTIGKIVMICELLILLVNFQTGDDIFSANACIGYKSDNVHLGNDLCYMQLAFKFVEVIKPY